MVSYLHSNPLYKLKSEIFIKRLESTARRLSKWFNQFRDKLFKLSSFLGAAKEAKPGASSLKGKRPAESLSGVKKEPGLSVPSSSLLGAKKPKLAGQTFTPLGRPLDERGRASPSTHIYHYDEIAKEGKEDVQT